jgi:YfiH family protein
VNAASPEYSVEDSPFGRIVVAPAVPDGFAVFYTTLDFDGRLTEGIAREITSFILGRFGIHASLTTCTQVHGKTAARAHHAEQWRECDSCDALWTNERHVALGIKVADCLPIAMIDPVHDVMANIHSGWRGTVQRITASTLDAISGSTAFDPREASAWLGPSIRACCFEVGEEVASQFDSAYIDRMHDKPHIDIAKLTIDVLRSRGFREERIHDSKLCTRCGGSQWGAGASPARTGKGAGAPPSLLFHSYRRDRTTGRTLALAAH